MKSLKLALLTAFVSLFISCTTDSPTESTTENTVPTVASFSVSTDSNQSVEITLRGSDADGDNLTYNIQPASSGNAVLNGNVVTYTPATDFVGTATINYRTSDGTATSSDAVITITVNALNPNTAPSANAVSETVEQGNSIAITLTATDSEDALGDLDFSIGTASNGTATLNGRVVSYTPNPNFIGTANITYTVTDSGGLTAAAVITITVGNTNTAPSANAVSETVEQGNNLTITLTATDSQDALGDLTFSIGTASNGSATLNGRVVSYTPNANFVGTDTLSYTVTDSDNLQGSAIITITVTAIPNTAPTAQDAINSDVSLTLVVDDAEDGSDSLDISYTNPANGTVSLSGLVLTYNPNPNFVGSDSLIILPPTAAVCKPRQWYK